MNTGLALSARQNRLFQDLLAAHDPHLAVVDLDTIYERAQIGLAEGDVARRELLEHGPRKAVDQNRADVLDGPWPDLARSSAASAFSRASLRSTIRVFRMSSTSSRPSSTSFVEMPQLVVRLLGLARQGCQTLINSSRPFRAPSSQRPQQASEPLWFQEPLCHVLCD